VSTPSTPGRAEAGSPVRFNAEGLSTSAGSGPDAFIPDARVSPSATFTYTAPAARFDTQSEGSPMTDDTDAQARRRHFLGLTHVGRAVLAAAADETPARAAQDPGPGPAGRGQATPESTAERRRHFLGATPAGRAVLADEDALGRQGGG